MRTQQLQLFAGRPSAAQDLSPRPSLHEQPSRAIEEADFPFERLSEVAAVESWRKEIYRPVYHVHKWWAQRLGSVFRGIVLGTFAPRGSDLMGLFYSQSRVPDAVVFDPFMGSGTTVGETLKLGGRAIGRDINPVAHLLVKTALGLPPRQEVTNTFRDIERDVSAEIQRFYRAQLPDGRISQALYYFWVKQAACPSCSRAVDLFASYIFSQHAYPVRYPDARALCPSCGAINVVAAQSSAATCGSCAHSFNPTAGPARGVGATCPECKHHFAIAKAVRSTAKPPGHRLYAKLVLTPNGEKLYLPIDDFDRTLYADAARALALQEGSYPVVPIYPGYNTNQVLNYSYRYWHEMFNDRQLLCLGILAKRIKEIRDEKERELFACLFSGALEFNNMFASFKGEGTGAVRHMFSHHVLKPERTPLEANLWGTPKSSGSFSTLFRGRILPAIDYCEEPFELRAEMSGGRMSGEKIYGLSSRMSHESAKRFSEFAGGKALYLSCGDSAETDIASGSVDAVITDPPFFDNVHYSELADFFYVWQRFILGQDERAANTTRSDREVQRSESGPFEERLTGVWQECHRVLRPDGLLVFSYHHSRAEGWKSVLGSLVLAGFVIVRAHPVKAEMSVAVPKRQAREPIDVDMILVCRKRVPLTRRGRLEWQALLADAIGEAERQVKRLLLSGRPVSRNDVRVVLMAQTIARVSQRPGEPAVAKGFEAFESRIEETIDALLAS